MQIGVDKDVGICSFDGGVVEYSFNSAVYNADSR